MVSVIKSVRMWLATVLATTGVDFVKDKRQQPLKTSWLDAKKTPIFFPD